MSLKGKDQTTTWEAILPQQIISEEYESLISKDSNIYKVCVEDFGVVSCNACQKTLLPSALLQHLNKCSGYSEAQKISLGTKTKKQKTELKKEKKKVHINLEIQCGVNIDGFPCSKPISCKQHAVSLKRAVPGRSRTYDILFKEYQSSKKGTLLN
jgi:hypothetical protein